MFRPSETANDLFRRVANNGLIFEYKISSKPTERLNFGDVVEVQAGAGDIPEVL